MCKFFSGKIKSIPLTLLNKVMVEAMNYTKCSYLWGGQDFYTKSPCYVDCSGFVINVYKGVLKKSKYVLLFKDTTVLEIYKKYSENIDIPLKGDLIFMGSDQKITHIALFEKFENGNIYFVDAYSKTSSISLRHYLIGNTKIISFGRMRVKKRSKCLE